MKPVTKGHRSGQLTCCDIANDPLQVKSVVESRFKMGVAGVEMMPRCGIKQAIKGCRTHSSGREQFESSLGPVVGVAVHGGLLPGGVQSIEMVEGALIPPPVDSPDRPDFTIALGLSYVVPDQSPRRQQQQEEYPRRGQHKAARVEMPVYGIGNCGNAK